MDRRSPEEDTRRVVEALKKIRIRKGFSQNALARRSGLSRAAISHIESGIRLPTLLTCFTLAESLEVSLAAVIENASRRRKPASSRGKN